MNRRLTMMLAGLWTIAVVWCQLAGWGLGLIGGLNRTGYLLSLLPGLAVAFLFVKQAMICCRVSQRPLYQPRKRMIRWNLKRFLKGFRMWQAVFIVICLVSLLGALINAPFGWDAYGYRIPRVVRWLQEERWLWLQSGDSRLDISSVVNEWQLAPILALFGSDRPIFLINFLPYMLFPGLIYVASRQTGITRSWALFIMWLIPMGYCFSLEGGGVQNDGVAGIHAVAAIAFLNARMRTVVSRRWSVSLSLINICLVSGLKLSNAPLAAALLIWWTWSIRKEFALLAHLNIGPLLTGVTCLVCSIAPVALLNKIHEGAWSGDSKNRYKCEATNYVAAPLVNAGYLLVDGLTPNPFAPRLNAVAARTIGKSAWVEWLVKEHPMAVFMRFSILAYEGMSGPGFPLLVAGPLCLVVACLRKRGRVRVAVSNILLAVSTLALAVYLMKMASPAAARIASSYFPVLGIGVIAWISGRGWQPWKAFNRLAFLLSSALVVVCLIFTTSRPILTRSVTRILDRKANDSYELHRYCSEEVGRFANHQSGQIYYVLHWGAIAHRLYAPYRKSGTAIEVGSTQWNQNRPRGRGLLAFSEAGIKKRYGISVVAFLGRLGSPTLVDQDRNVPEIATENALFLYDVADLSKIPDPVFSRTYTSDDKLFEVISDSIQDSPPDAK